MSARRPVVGVFDSGVGGLTVLRELLRQVPGADYLYFGDTARLPYGSKSAETVAQYALAAARYLEDHGAEALVVACNTASALALPALQSGLRIPVLGVVAPGARAAARLSRRKLAAVLGTEATIRSHAYQSALAALGVRTVEKPCPLFVPLVEEGWTDHAVTEQVAHIYLDDIFSRGEEPDVLVLGCTHYPLLRPLLRRITPETVAIVDSAEATAAALAETIEAAAAGEPELRFFATDSVEKFRSLGERFLARKLPEVELVRLD